MQLEETAVNPWISLGLVDGKWALLWSTVAAPERASSPLFWAVQAFTDTLTQQGTAGMVFRLTDAIKGAVGLRCALLAPSRGCCRDTPHTAPRSLSWVRCGN